MRSVDTYEVLVVEQDYKGDNIYYVRYYPESREHKGIDMRLSEDQMENFIIGKVEV